jgi:predicted AAA+ superfamily ATPase
MKRNVTQKLLQWKNSKRRKPLILRGARQVGKTYSLLEFGKNFFPNYHYINFEKDERARSLFDKDLDPARILEELKFYLDTSIEEQSDLIIFDEIQHCPRALTALKYFCEQVPELALCAAGSLLGVYLADESFPVGKVTLLDLYPMNFVEFLEGIGQHQLTELLNSYVISRTLPKTAHDRLWDLWKTYLIVGGLPEVVAAYRDDMEDQYKAVKTIRVLQSDLIDTYMADIAKHSGKVNALHIERLWRNITHQLARSQDGSAPKFRFKDVVPGIRGYERLSSPISWLEKAGLILRTSIVERAEIPLSSYSRENRFKQYFFDVGLLGALSGIDPARFFAYDIKNYKGYIAENFVAQEFRSSGISALYCWAGRTSEVEFLLESAEGIIPIEVKAGSITKSKSLKVYEERYRPKKSIVLSARNIESHGQRVHVPIYLAGVLREYFIRKN